MRRALNAIVATVDAADIDALSRLPGVKAVRPLVLEYPNNNNSVPFVGAPSVWATTTGAGFPVTGLGMRIGIIDTGVDYQHATFGGNSQLLAYQGNDRTVAPDAFYPSAKVVGGWDFAGDAYNGAVAPAPDADPMDCNGHGTHVAATAAGWGVNGDGSTYGGPWGPAAPFGSMRIGPGTAPGAQIYALRVFGCGGGTGLVLQAIDWALDPNDDGDLSDHLDVINMSLGSPFGTLSSSSAAASDNAVRAGMIVVTSAGNDGDTFYVSGSPGSGNRVIATAATADSSLSGPLLQVNAPGALARGYALGGAAFGPAFPVFGVTGNVVQALDGADVTGPSTTDGCTLLTNAADIAGRIALIDRGGTCGFAAKVKNAQDAGAIAAIIVNTSTGLFGNLGGTDATITIPSGMMKHDDGNLLKDALGNLLTVNVTLRQAASGDTIGGFTSRGPRGQSGAIAVKPDIAAPGVAITSARTGVTCTSAATGCLAPDASGFAPDSQPLDLQGTSMAAPHMAGIMALLRQLHPDWTVEELKALAMNHALHDISEAPGLGGSRYGPARIGAGRVDTELAAAASVVAYNAEDPGVVSVSFDVPEVVTTRTQTKTIRLVNHGTTAQTYDLGIDAVVDAPGIDFSVPGSSSVTVPPGQTIDIAVQVSAIADQMDHMREATVAPTQVVAAPASLANLTIPRHWMTEESGYLTLSQASTMKLRVPLHATARPASAMSGGPIVTGGAPTGSTNILLNGTGVCTGTLSGTCSGTAPTDVASLVSPFELQVVSPRVPGLPAHLDLQYAGVATDTTRIWFGVSTWGDWSSPTDTSFNIYVDNNLDGVYDRVIVNLNSGSLARLYFGQPSQDDLDTFITSVLVPPSTFSNNISGVPNYVNRLDASEADTALFNTNVLFLGATPNQLGLANAAAPFRYWIKTCPGNAALCQEFHGFVIDEANGPYFWNGGAQGLNFSGSTLANDLDNAQIPVQWNTANMTTNGSLGALLLHHHNRAGERAQVVLLDTAQSTDLSLTFSAAPAAPALGQNTTLTLTVTNNAVAQAASGIAVDIDLPAGLAYVSNDSGGSLNTFLGTWTIGALAPGASATIHIVATADSVGPMQARATITAATPLDTVPANNQVVLNFNTPGQTDLLITAGAVAPTVVAGNAAGYTITITNTGSEPAHSVTVANTLTAGTGALLSGTPTVGVFTLGTGTWNIATLAPGASASLDVTATATAGPALTIQAQGASSVSDPNNGNNIATASTTVTTRSTLTGVTRNPTTILAGGSSTVTVTVTDTEASGTKSNPAGSVTFGSSVASDVFSSASCVLAAVPLTTDQSSCQVTVTPAVASVHTISAAYTANVTHAASGNAANLTVDPRPTSTTTALTPTTILSGNASTVTVTVTDTEASGTKTNPAGTVNIGSAIGGDVLSSPSCALVAVPATTDRSSCQVTVTATTVSVHAISAGFAGSGTHAGSAAAAANLTVDLRPTTTTTTNTTAVANDDSQNVAFSATVTGGLPVNQGTVTFTVRDASSTIVGVPVTSGIVANGAASASYVLPGGTAAQVLSVIAVYSGGATFQTSTSSSATLTITEAPPPPPTLTYLIAEGATGVFFDFDVLIANPNDVAAPITVTFLKENGTSVTLTRTLDPMTRATIHVDEVEGMAETSASTVVESTTGVPLVVERTMRWDATGYGSHTEKATLGPASTWYFAEGSQGYFSTFLLLANPATTANVAHITYFREGEPAVTRNYDLLPSSRTTIFAGDDPALIDRAFGAQVTFDLPGLAERSTYFGASPLWSGGHASAGTNAPAQNWFVAEGATGSFFSTYLLLANPNVDPANVTVTYLPASGAPIVRTHGVAGQGRVTIDISTEDVLLASTAVGARIEADRPIVVERAQYWPQPTWIEGHSSAGVTEAAMRWGLAEGQVGGTSQYQTYILLANPGSEAASVTVRLLRASGTPIVKTLTVAAGSRVNVSVFGAGSDVPELVDESFGAVIESTQPIVVERSVYSNAGGVIWAAGTNATATRLPSPQ